MKWILISITMKTNINFYKLCSFEEKFDAFHIFANSLEEGSFEQKVVISLLHDYPINDIQKEKIIVPVIEKVIDLISSKLIPS